MTSSVLECEQVESVVESAGVHVCLGCCTLKPSEVFQGVLCGKQAPVHVVVNC